MPEYLFRLVTSISIWGHRLKSADGLWPIISLLRIWNWPGLPFKWTLLGSTARTNKQTKTQVTGIVLAPWNMPCGRHGLNSWRAWHWSGQQNKNESRWQLSTFQKLFLCNHVPCLTLSAMSLSCSGPDRWCLRAVAFCSFSLSSVVTFPWEQTLLTIWCFFWGMLSPFPCCTTLLQQPVALVFMYFPLD